MNKKAKWEEAIYEAAARGKRFDHDDDCPVIFRPRSVTNCKCGASEANKALDEIAKELRVGIPLSA